MIYQCTCSNGYCIEKHSVCIDTRLAFILHVVMMAKLHNMYHLSPGGSDKVTRSCDKNVDESAILRIPSFLVELTLVYFYSLCSCLVFSVYR